MQHDAIMPQARTLRCCVRSRPETAYSVRDLLRGPRQRIGTEHRRRQSELGERGAAFLQRLTHQIAAVQVQQVEDAVRERMCGLLVQGLKRRPPFASTATSSPSRMAFVAWRAVTARVIAGYCFVASFRLREYSVAVYMCRMTSSLDVKSEIPAWKVEVHAWP